MLYYQDGSEVHVGDHVRHSHADAVIETIIEGDEVDSWQIKEPGFLLRCEECGRVLVNPGSFDWKDVLLIHREAKS